MTDPDLLPPNIVNRLAGRLHEARLGRSPVARLTDSYPNLTEADAYRIADRGVALRMAAGERVVGAKLGFTSEAMRTAMGIDSPNYGWLTDPMIVSDGTVSLGGLIHPKAEPEIGFVLARDLAGGAVSAAEVLAATAFVLPVIEVVDSRFEDFRFRAFDNTADNSSAGMVVLGRRATLPDFDLSRIGVVVYVNGELLYSAAGAAAFGYPAASVAWLVRRLAESGRGLKAGHLVISGGLTGPIELEPGTFVNVEMDRIGSVTMSVHS